MLPWFLFFHSAFAVYKDRLGWHCWPTISQSRHFVPTLIVLNQGAEPWNYFVMTRMLKNKQMDYYSIISRSQTFCRMIFLKITWKCQGWRLLTFSKLYLKKQSIACTSLWILSKFLNSFFTEQILKTASVITILHIIVTCLFNKTMMI